MDQNQLKPFCVRTRGLSDKRIAELLEMAIKAGARPGKGVDIQPCVDDDAFKVSSQWEFVGVNDQCETEFFVQRVNEDVDLFSKGRAEAKPPRVVTASWIRSYLLSISDEDRVLKFN